MIIRIKFSERSESNIGRFAVDTHIRRQGGSHGHGILVDRSLVPLNSWATVAHMVGKVGVEL